MGEKIQRMSGVTRDDGMFDNGFRGIARRFQVGR